MSATLTETVMAQNPVTIKSINFNPTTTRKLKSSFKDISEIDETKYWYNWPTRNIIRLCFKTWTDDDIKAKWSRVYDYVSAHSTKLVPAGFFLPDPKYKDKIMRHQLGFFIRIFRGELKEIQVYRIIKTHMRLGITEELFDEMLRLVCDSVCGDNPIIPEFIVRKSIDQFRLFVITTSPFNTTTAPAAK